MKNSELSSAAEPAGPKRPRDACGPSLVLNACSWETENSALPSEATPAGPMRPLDACRPSLVLDASGREAENSALPSAAKPAGPKRPLDACRGLMAPCVTPGETGDQREASEDGVHENRQANKEASGEWLMLGSCHSVMIYG